MVHRHSTNRFIHGLVLAFIVVLAACGVDSSQVPSTEGQSALAPARIGASAHIDQLLATQQAKLTASDGAAEDGFGWPVALSGDTAIVGAADDDIGANINQGSAYVFVRNGGVWTQQQQLIASDGTAGEFFGYSVGISGDTAIVGAQRDDVGTNIGQGSAYVFVRNGGTWTEQAKLTASDGAVSDFFGSSVALSGDTVIVGVERKNVGANSYQGSAYVFARNGGVWTQQQKLTASDGLAGDAFGCVVGLSGDTAIVGAYGDDIVADSQGSSYVFVRNGTVWAEQQKLTASDAAAGDFFGYSASLAGDTAIVGARHHNVGANNDQGSAYVFVRNGNVWTQQQQLTASDGAANDEFGYSVVLSVDVAVVSASRDDAGANSDQGSAYVFVRNGAVWSEQQKLMASDGMMGDGFAESVSLSGNTVIVSAQHDDISANSNQGSAYVFLLDLTNGNACTVGADCTSGFCVDGVCCDSVCGDGNPGDCQACSVAAGAAVDGLCAPAAMGTTCRASAGACDVAEICDGAANDCPSDVMAPDGTSCAGGTCSNGVCMGQGGNGGFAGAGGSSSSSSSSGGSAGSGGESASSSSSSGGTNPSEDGGCACRIATPNGPAFTAPLSLLGVALLFALRRRPTT